MSSRLVRFNRLLSFELPQGQSAFLWGARKTGKSTYLKEKYPNSIRYDLLLSDEYLRLLNSPHLLREEILALPSEAFNEPIIIDEVQKIPLLLDEIHWLIENTPARFILCGSSARKLKHGAANLLGGRAWRFTFYPLVSAEIPEFNLLHALQNGLVPSHYIASNAERSLRAYVKDYLKEEIQAEGLTRNLRAFSRFLDSVPFSNGEIVNYSNIARDCAIDAKTVKEYYQILEDTLIGYFVYPFSKKRKREIIQATPKFYLFDVGVANFLSKRKIEVLKGIEAGHAFEHFILMELMAYKGIKEKDFELTFWRTKTKLEVDFILGDAEVAIEVKISEQIDKKDINGLIAFQEEHNPKLALVVCLAPRPRKIKTTEDKDITILPYQTFLEQLWNGKII